MKIAITADPFIPVPPVLYGGIERIIAMLIEELLRQGHEVTLFAHKESIVNCELIPYGDSVGIKGLFRNSYLIGKTLRSRKFDIVHSFGRLAYLLPVLPSALPKLMSYQREPTISQIKKAVRLSKTNTMAFTGCSNYISNKIAPFATVNTVYNCIDINKYSLEKPTPQNAVDPERPLVFLGRIEPIKGTHTAIEIAIATGKKLVIAGNVDSQHEAYFNTEIKPFLNDQISYTGPVNDEQKNKLLQNAYAFLMPIHWNEPFGIVMIEAMACGTPVIGFSRGAVPEVVVHGETGFVGNTIEELIGFVSTVEQLDRQRVQDYTHKFFSSTVITEQYLTIYKKMAG